MRSGNTYNCKGNFGNYFLIITRTFCPDELYLSCQTQIPIAQGNIVHLSFLKSFPSAITFRTGISFILMFPISDSLKYIW